MAVEGSVSERAEWRRYWFVPVSAAMGYSAAGLQSYGFGPFVGPLEKEFGWSRAEVMLGLSITGTFGLLFSVGVGLCIDRFGPRKVGLLGLTLKCGGFALLATATGSLLNWSLLWAVVSLGVILVQANAWTSAVSSRFDRSRGFAVAVALTGSSITAIVAPVLAEFLTSLYGWRVAMAAVGVLWFSLTAPFVFLFFRGAQDQVQDRAGSGLSRHVDHQLPGVTVRDGLRMPVFWIIAGSNFAFAFYTMSLAPNLVSLLGDKGVTARSAAQIASLVGVVSLVARLSGGFLLDRFPANAVAAVIFLLPVAGCAMMLNGHASPIWLAIAVGSFGATIGAEHDVVFYMTSRHLGLKHFASLLGVMMTGAALAAIVAPVIAGWIHDRFGSYDRLLWLLMAMMAMAGIAMSTVRDPKLRAG